jgi:transcriptional regulator with XRE-family HTH domain
MVKINAVSVKIGKSIRKIREEKAITQEQLALEAGLNRAYIGYIERGERNPTIKTLEKIAKILKVSTKELL